MAKSYLVPILAAGGISFFTNWYQSKTIDLKIPVATGLACGLAALIAQAPGAEPVVTGVAWVALAGVLLTGPAATVATDLVKGL
jgi:hypothetical protein